MASQTQAIEDVSTDEFVFGANLVRDKTYNDFDRKCYCPMSTFRELTDEPTEMAGDVMERYDAILAKRKCEARGIVDEDTAREAWLAAIDVATDAAWADPDDVEKAVEVAEFFDWTFFDWT